MIRFPQNCEFSTSVPHNYDNCLAYSPNKTWHILYYVGVRAYKATASQWRSYSSRGMRRRALVMK